MTKKEAKEKVIDAARKWVNFEDPGTIEGLKKLTRLQINLAKAVTRLERMEKK